MRIRISDATTYHYDAPPAGVTQVLRLTPRNHDGQYVISWRIDLSEDCLLHQQDDAFGNLVHSFTAEGPFDKLTVAVVGEVDTHDTTGVVSGAMERFPPGLFLRDTDLTLADHAIVEFAEDARTTAGSDSLTVLHALMAALHENMKFKIDAATPTPGTAAQAFGKRSGSSQDLAHVFIAASRHLGIPTRYVGGYLYRGDDAEGHDTGHAWAEAYIDRLGWVGFDPTAKVSTTDAYVRIAIGLDYFGAAPVRGTRYGGNGETAEIALHVDSAREQSQWQSQT